MLQCLNRLNYISARTNNRVMYVKRVAATTNKTRDQGNQNPRVPKFNLKKQKKRLSHTVCFIL